MKKRSLLVLFAFLHLATIASKKKLKSFCRRTLNCMDGGTESAPLTTSILESVMPEVLEIIFSFLSVQDVASCCRVCKTWHNLVVGKPPHDDLSALLWRQLLERDYPHVPTSHTST